VWNGRIDRGQLYASTFMPDGVLDYGEGDVKGREASPRNTIGGFGHYEDELVKVNGQWFFTKRLVEAILWTRRVNMRRMILTVPIIAGLLLSCSVQSRAADAVACTMITQAHVSEALGISVPAGTAISRPGTCQWMGKGRFATLTITLPRGGKSPVEQFNAGKKGLAGITIEPGSGVGDDAYYVYYSGTTRAGLGLVVKKGSNEFEVRVYGFDLDKAKPVAKTLAQEAAGKI